MRLNKFLTKAGVCSRRKAEHLINEGRVTVNGKKAQITTAVGLEDRVKVDGEVLFSKVHRIMKLMLFTNQEVLFVLYLQRNDLT